MQGLQLNNSTYKKTTIKKRNTIFTLFIKLICISVKRTVLSELNLYKITLRSTDFFLYIYTFPCFLTRLKWIYIFALM